MLKVSTKFYYRSYKMKRSDERWFYLLAAGLCASVLLLSCASPDTETTDSDPVDPPVSTYSITYNSNGASGGTVPTDSTKYKKGDTVSVLSNSGTLVKSNYTFDGWNTLTSGSGTTYVGGDTFKMGDTNSTLYAKWTAKPAIPAKLAAPANLEAYAWFGYSLSLEWQPVTGAVSYNVYGSSGSSMIKLGNTTDTEYNDHSTYIAYPDTSRLYYVTAVDKDSIEGEKSSIINESTLSTANLVTNIDKTNAKAFSAGTYCFNDYFFPGQDHLWFSYTKGRTTNTITKTLNFSSLYGMTLTVNIYSGTTLLGGVTVNQNNPVVSFTAGTSGGTYYYELIWDETGFETGEFVVN
jgi:uncharacterized repeat protein (TIGR02543 family)